MWQICTEKKDAKFNNIYNKFVQFFLEIQANLPYFQ